MIEQISEILPFLDQYQLRVEQAAAKDALSFGLASGRSGVALSLLSTVAYRPKIYGLINELLWADLELIGSYGPSLFSGSCGVALAADIIGTALKVDEYNEILSDFDNYLLDSLTAGEARSFHFDVISGVSGIGLYALHRVKKNADISSILVNRSVELLAASSHLEDGMTTWINHPRSFSTKLSESTSLSSVDLGVAHGVPGVLGFLAKASKLCAPTNRAFGLLDDGVRWLCSQCNPSSFNSTFGYRAKQPSESRTAWCYGDLGILAVLADAPSFRKEFTELKFQHTLARQVSRTLVATQINDAYLCHGFAGSYLLACALAPFCGSSELPAFAGRMRSGFLQAVKEDFMQKENAPIGFLEGYGGVLAAAHLGYGDLVPAWAAPFGFIRN